MNEPQEKTTLISVFSSVLMLSFYGRLGKDAYLALALSSALLIFLGGLIYFLRIVLSTAWVRVFIVVLAASAAQVVWIKQGLEPWWVLAALSLLLPAADQLRVSGKMFELTLQGLLLEAAALSFFTARSALELTASRFFWEQSAGHLSLLGLIALAVGIVEMRGTKQDD